MTLVPFLALSGLELILRLAGYGYRTSYFLPTEIDQRSFLVPNDKFGYRFFPRALVRNPLPLRMPVEKATNCYRIFVLGESAAQGDPDPTFGFSRYLEVLLRDRFPGTEFEVICVAMTAINSHVILPIARECAQHQGDLWLIYMGNNEMVGPFGAGTVFGPETPPLGLIRTSLMAKTSRVGQLIQSQTQRFVGQPSTNEAWGGMKMFLGHQLRFDDPKRSNAYHSFRRNLEDILQAGMGAGVPIILSTVGSNLKDCSPFGSLHPAHFDGTQLADWNTAFQEGVAHQAVGDFLGALKAYSNAAAIDPQFAELRFQMGHCEMALTNMEFALHEYELARDFDSLAFRADTRINKIIKEVATRHANDGVLLLDAEALLGRVSPQRIAGRELFYEHVHLNFTGNYLLARGFAEQIDELLPIAIRSRAQGTWLPEEMCDRRLAVTTWDRYRVWNINLRRLLEPPFVGQSDHEKQVKTCEARLNEIADRMNTSETPALAREMYEHAVAQAPGDYFLHSNFSQFLDATEDLDLSLKEQQRVCELLPHTSVPYYRIGKILMRQGRTAEAAVRFSKAIALQPEFGRALNEMGLLLANQYKMSEALACFSRASQCDPGFADTHLNWGFVEQSFGRLDQAISHYQEAARREPGGPAAHFSQGVAFALQQRRREAISAFREATKLRPGFWQASYLLGVELASEERIQEAQTEFAKVISYRPDYARARLNLGVSLAKQGLFDQAMVQFQACLRLNPTNKLAQQHINTIQGLKDRGR